MNTCTVCFGDNAHEEPYCIYCGARLGTVGATEPLGMTIGSLPVRALYYRTGEGLWFKLSDITHVPVELGPLGIIGKALPSDLYADEIVQPYRSR